MLTFLASSCSRNRRSLPVVLAPDESITSPLSDLASTFLCGHVARSLRPCGPNLIIRPSIGYSPLTTHPQTTPLSSSSSTSSYGLASTSLAINNNNNKLQTFCPHRLGLADERDTVLVSTGLFEGLCIYGPTSVAPIPELFGSNMYYVRGRHGRAYDTDFPIVCDTSLYDTTAPQGCAAEMKGYTIFMNKNVIHLHVRPCDKL